MSEKFSPEHEAAPAHRWSQEPFEEDINPNRAKKLFAVAPQPTEDPDQDLRFLGLAPPRETQPAVPDNLPKQTPAGREASAHRLDGVMRKDAKFTELVAGHVGQVSADSLVDQLHTNPDLRLAAGIHFLGKLDQLADSHTGKLILPDRVAYNDSLKTPSKTQLYINSMTSREYVAVLCLAKLDGTYDPDADRYDPIEYDKAHSGDFLGQHRYTADLLLDKYEITHGGNYRLLN